MSNRSRRIMLSTLEQRRNSKLFRYTENKNKKNRPASMRSRVLFDNYFGRLLQCAKPYPFFFCGPEIRLIISFPVAPLLYTGGAAPIRTDAYLDRRQSGLKRDSAFTRLNQDRADCAFE